MIYLLTEKSENVTLLVFASQKMFLETTAAVGLWRMSNISKWNKCFGYDNYNLSEAEGCLLIFIDVEYQKRQWMI